MTISHYSTPKIRSHIKKIIEFNRQHCADDLIKNDLLLKDKYTRKLLAYFLQGKEEHYQLNKYLTDYLLNESDETKTALVNYLTIGLNDDTYVDICNEKIDLCGRSIVFTSAYKHLYNSIKSNILYRAENKNRIIILLISDLFSRHKRDIDILFHEVEQEIWQDNHDYSENQWRRYDEQRGAI